LLWIAPLSLASVSMSISVPPPMRAVALIRTGLPKA
jgi:hypothetical protein